MSQQASILVVDDADTIRHLMRFSLSKAGFEVKVAANGHDALALARNNKFDAIFTDIHMPEMDGISLIKALRELPGYASTPILALTMTNTDHIKNTGKEAGATGWINKPVSPPRVIELLARLGVATIPPTGQFA
ncbi:MAG: response regulator [Gammaproteobacteria bacterium]|nr:response regulator [Gammaproteobacteria bacterium]MDH5776881.1 response regulator [Gammaproteobacteria bacterium]